MIRKPSSTKQGSANPFGAHTNLVLQKNVSKSNLQIIRLPAFGDQRLLLDELDVVVLGEGGRQHRVVQVQVVLILFKACRKENTASVNFFATFGEASL